MRSASKNKSFSGSLEQFFLTVSQINLGNKIPSLLHSILVLLTPFSPESEIFATCWAQGIKLSKSRQSRYVCVVLSKLSFPEGILRISEACVAFNLYENKTCNIWKQSDSEFLFFYTFTSFVLEIQRVIYMI